MKDYRDPVHRAEMLKRVREQAPSLFRATEQEQREIARRLGCEDHLPDPQASLPLQVAA